MEFTTEESAQHWVQLGISQACALPQIPTFKCWGVIHGEDGPHLRDISGIFFDLQLVTKLTQHGPPAHAEGFVGTDTIAQANVWVVAAATSGGRTWGTGPQKRKPRSGHPARRISEPGLAGVTVAIATTCHLSVRARRKVAIFVTVAPQRFARRSGGHGGRLSSVAKLR